MGAACGTRNASSSQTWRARMGMHLVRSTTLICVFRTGPLNHDDVLPSLAHVPHQVAALHRTKDVKPTRRSRRPQS